ncbi:ATP-binding protein [candidate division WOR-3 bacterium]|nr:ATP-binding protein [candidate division WOR-3 bacterium]
MTVAVASGKGGTGKTTVAVSLALVSGSQYLDCDVEEPNGHIFLKPDIRRVEPVNKLVPQVDLERCTFCHRCSQACAFHALAVLPKQVLVFPELCHSCGMCEWLCPEGAISERELPIGVVETGDSLDVELAPGDDDAQPDYVVIPFVQGRLNIGEPMAVPVIRAVKREIRTDRDAILDVPPGTSCPVVQSVLGCDFCLLVTEPTPFGLHDLKLAVETVRKLGVRFGVVLNQADVGDDETERYCREENIEVLMRIPYDRAIAEAYSSGVPAIKARPEYLTAFKQLSEEIRARAEK